MIALLLLALLWAVVYFTRPERRPARIETAHPDYVMIRSSLTRPTDSGKDSADLGA